MSPIAQGHPAGRFAAALVIVLIAALGVFLLPSRAADPAEAAAQTFDVPSGDASVTIKEFAKQAQRAIMYPSEPLNGVRTDAIKGDFGPKAALQRMLSGTGFVAIEDAKTGALAIKPMAGPSAQGTTPGADPDERLHVIVTGQSMIRYDAREVAPQSVAAMRTFLSGADAIFTNLEGAISGPGAGTPTRDLKRSPSLLHSFAPAVLDALSAEGFNLIALASNHSWDLGTGGIVSTLDAVEARRLAHAGTGRTIAAATAPAILVTPRGRVALVAMASGHIGADAASTELRPGVDELRLDETTQKPFPADAERILASIRAAAGEADCVIVYDHNHYWAKEVTATPGWLLGWARACVDAGASLFVEHGEPLLHGLEIYRGRAIFYGLGNYIFQTRVHQQPEVWEGIVADGYFSAGRLVELRLRPLLLGDQVEPGDPLMRARGFPLPATGTQARTILEHLSDLSRDYGTKFEFDGDLATIKLSP